MTLSPEVNDVDISKLFQWREEKKIKDINGEEFTVYMRLIGDAELNRARVAGLRASGELRKKFKDINSDEYLAYVPDDESMELENLVELYLYLNMPNYRESIEKTTKIPFPKEVSSEATLEQKEKYQEEVDNYPNKRLEVIRKELDKKVEKERTLLNKKPKEYVIDLYKKLIINNMCESRLNTVFLGTSVVFATYKDNEYKERLFKSFDEFDNLPTFAKEQFIEAYIDLQINVTNLKK